MRRHVTTFRQPADAIAAPLAAALAAALLLLLILPGTLSAQPARLGVTDAYRAAQAGEIILVDIRTPGEWQDTGIAEGAVALDMQAKDFIPALIALRERNPGKRIAFICAVGGRSGYLNRFLYKNGFGNTADVPEGMLGSSAGPGWLKAGLPVYPGEAAEIERRRRALFGSP